MRILGIEQPDQIHLLKKEDLVGGTIHKDEFDHLLRVVGGLWLHSGDPSAPHAELTGGECSDGFVDTLRLLKYPNVCLLLAEQMANIYTAYMAKLPAWVIGSDHAAATFSFAVAYHLKAKHAFTEKGPDGKTQLWKRETIKPGEIVLHAEELVTTTATLDRVHDGIVEGNTHPVTFAPVSLTLVHRSSSYEFNGGDILYFRHYDINKWKPEECPLCAAGSQRLRPKQNWEQLTAA